MKKILSSLPVRLIIGVVIGIIIGLGSADLWIGGTDVGGTIMQVVLTLKNLLGSLINFCVPLIIIGFIAPSITRLRSNASRMLVLALALAYTSSVCAALMSMGAGYAIIPGLSIQSAAEGLREAPELLFNLDIAPVMSVMSALVFSVLVGLAATWTRAKVITQVLEEFTELIDPKSGNPLMDRTTLIANTSNMPVAAREASLYSGLTLAEYYRDMGYHVAIMADSTSRWAEALRELSGRLEEMPAEEGFPAYLASKLSAFYERAGMVQNLNQTEGSVTIIGAVSPQGGDFSEPVTMNTKRFVRCFWGLDKSLAYARHFPAIHWLTSYSEYINDLAPWYTDHVSKKFVDYRNRLMALLNQESNLMEIVKLIGADVLPDDQKLVLEIARVIRLGFLQQNAFHKDDTSVPMEKQFKMMEVILYLYKKSRALVGMGMPVSVLREEKIFDRIISIKYDVPNDRLDMFDDYMKQIDQFYDRVVEQNA